jgi:hypothetical protein
MATKAELKARLSLDTALFERGIAAAHSGAARLGSAFSGASGIGVAAWGKLAGVVAALGGAAGFVKGVKGAIDLGESLKNMSDRTGIAVDKLVILEQAFREAGLEADDIGLSINRMQRYIERAGPQKLGEAFFVLRQLRPEQQFQVLANAINSMGTASERGEAAMEAFGRGGGKLLAVFAKSGGLGDIQKDLGKQAELLRQNADAFAKAADLLKRTSTQFRGFFVGVAAGLINTLGPIIDKVSKIDFTEVGKKFGQALVAGAQALVGFFKNPELLFFAAKEGFKAALMEGANVLIAIFKAAIQFFQQGLVSMFVGLGDVIIGVLLQAFAKPIAYLQAGLEAAINSVTSGGAMDVAAHKLDVQFLENMKKGAASGDIIQKGFWAAIGGDQKLAEAKAELAKSIAAQQAIPQQSIGQRAQEILKQGGPGFGIFETKTAQQYLDEGSKKLSEAFDAAAKVLKNLKVDDVMGASQALANVMAATQAAIDQGKEVLIKNLGVRRIAGPGESQEAIDQIEANRLAFEKAQKEGINPPGAPETPQEMQDRMMLSLRQRFEEHPVFSLPPMMRDIFGPGAIMGAFGVQGAAGLGGPHAIVSDRHARREAWLREKAERGSKQGVEKSNELLSGIKTATEETADAWKE